MSDLPLYLRLIRAALRRLNTSATRRRERRRARPAPPQPGCAAELAALRQLHLADPAAQAYFEKHLPRLAATLALVPPATAPGRVLELGCYMQITPALQYCRGFREIRGAAFGHGPPQRQSVSYGAAAFELDIDLFDAEREPFPYPSGHFELVLACEVIEHLLTDPMHLLLESRRVLAEGGRLLITTPNIAGLTSVARVLHGHDNPQIHSKYRIPRPAALPEIQHVREYTLAELGHAVIAAGFEIERLFTLPIPEYSFYQPLLRFLEENGYNPANRGEQSYCLARKRAALPVTRYPDFLYEE